MSTQAQQKSLSEKKDKMARPITYVNIAIGVIIMLIGFFLPPFYTITEVGMRVLFIFIGVIYLWSTVETLWSSLLAIVMIGISGYAPMAKVLTNSFGNTTIILIFFSFVFFGGLVDCGVGKYISRFFLTRKICNGHPYIFFFIYGFGLFVLSFLVKPFATLMISWPISYIIIQDLGYTREDKTAKFIVFLTFVGSILGQLSFPFRSTCLAIITAFSNAYGSAIPFTSFLAFELIMAVCIIGVLLILGKFILKIDVTNLKKIDVSMFDKDPLPPMSTLQKFYSAMAIIYLICMLLPSVINGDVPIVKQINLLGSTAVTILVVIICSVVRLNGQQVLDFKKSCNKNMSWSVIFLVVVALYFSSALLNEATGIRPCIMAVLNPLLGGRSMWSLMCILCIFCFLLTNVANNQVCAMVILPAFGAFAQESGLPPEIAYPIATASTLCLYLAFLTPAASPFAGMLFANKDWLEPSDVLKMAIPFAIMVLFLYCTVGFFLGSILF